MSKNEITIEAVLDDAPAKKQQRELKKETERINAALAETENRTKTAFDNALGAMRAGYMMVSGLAKLMGTNMSEIFSSMFGLATAGIATYTAMSVAIEALGIGTLNPVMVLEAGVALLSLVSAMISLGAMITGQQDLSSAVDGINMSLQGFSSLIEGFNFE